MAWFRIFAMYVRTELVHMYIAKRPSFLLYRFLAVPKMGTATSIIKIWVGDSPTPFWQDEGVVKHDILTLPEKGTARHRPLDFIEDFLYMRELAFFAVYVCTRFVRWHTANALQAHRFICPK